jgi:hypothetical protein
MTNNVQLTPDEIDLRALFIALRLQLLFVLTLTISFCSIADVLRYFFILKSKLRQLCRQTSVTNMPLRSLPPLLLLRKSVVPNELSSSFLY